MDPKETYIAKLSNVIKPAGGDPKSFIEVLRVYKKDDLPQHILEKYGEFISSAELFLSDEKIYLYVESIKAKSNVVTAEEYGELGVTCDSIFFTRAQFDSENKVIVPDPSAWTKDCICQKPTNPDLQYIACECGRWFHLECVQAKIFSNIFICDFCLEGH